MWCHYLEGTICTMMVYSDDQNLEYFTTMKVLNRRQGRWVQELVADQFKIFTTRVPKMEKWMHLSRGSEYRPAKLGTEDQPIAMILSPKTFLQINKEEN
jgi:hypothetical protein